MVNISISYIVLDYSDKWYFDKISMIYHDIFVFNDK